MGVRTHIGQLRDGSMKTSENNFKCHERTPILNTRSSAVAERPRDASCHCLGFWGPPYVQGLRWLLGLVSTKCPVEDRKHNRTPQEAACQDAQ